jgi:hypothetical protein
MSKEKNINYAYLLVGIQLCWICCRGIFVIVVIFRLALLFVACLRAINVTRSRLSTQMENGVHKVSGCVEPDVTHRGDGYENLPTRLA